MRGWAGSSKRDPHADGPLEIGHPGCPVRRGVGGGRGSALTLLLVSSLVAGLGVGCASRRQVPAPVPVPVSAPPVPESAETPKAPRTAPAGSSRDDSFPPLPGTDRIYPSQDPRNHARADAPEAFPLAGATDAPVVTGIVPERVAADPVAASTTTADRGAPSPARPAAWAVQLLASSSASVARERAGALAPYFPEPPRVEPMAGLFKVRVGRCATRDEAEALRRQALELGLRDAFVVPAEAGDGTPP